MCCDSNAYDQNQIEGLATYDNSLYPYRAGTYDQNQVEGLATCDNSLYPYRAGT